MNAISLEMNGRSELEEDRQHGIPQRLARVSGLLYLVLFVFGMFSPLVLEALVVEGDVVATADKLSGSLGLFGVSLVTWVVIVLADIAISVTLYMLLEPAGRALSMATAAFRIVYSTMLGVFLLNLFEAFTLLNGSDSAIGRDTQQIQAAALTAIESFEDGFVLALMFFGAHLVLLGVLLYRSGYVPRVLALVLAIAGAGYIADGLANFFLSSHSDTVTIVLLTPALLGEFGLTAWLLLKGVKTRQRPTA